MVNINCISPSTIGAFAGCTWKLMMDSLYPQEDSEQYRPQQDFGTVCHYHAQTGKGVDPVPTKYSQDAWDSARKCPGMSGKSPEEFLQHIEACAKLANGVVDAVTGTELGPIGKRKWLAEEKIYSAKYLKERVSRTGVKGFGGSIDLMLSDRSILWDYKFTGTIGYPLSSGENKPKNDYIWQLGSYHLVSGVPKTGIVWVRRDAGASCYLLIDWTTPATLPLAEAMRSFLGYVEGGAKVAWPVRGESCLWCRQRARCPLEQLDAIRDGNDATAQARFRATTTPFDFSFGPRKEAAPPQLPPPPPIPVEYCENLF
jgi:hypothetical protein